VSAYVIGVDFGGTIIKAVAVDRAGRILRQDRFATPADNRAAWTQAIGGHVATVERMLGPAAGVGIACPGLAARDGRSIAWMQGRLAAVQGLDWTQLLRRAQPVPVLNDAHAALLGEAWLGAARGASDAIMLTLGTGVGGAILSDGRLLRGHLGRAGHMGHISLDPTGTRDIVNTPGSLEEAIGQCSLPQRSGGRFEFTRDLVAAVQAGDAGAVEIWTESIQYLAAGIASLINVIDPQIVIVGGGIATAGPMLFEPLQRFLDEFEWRPMGAGVRVVPAELGDMAGALGATKSVWDDAPAEKEPPRE
jgi:glucokinase